MARCLARTSCTRRSYDCASESAGGCTVRGAYAVSYGNDQAVVAALITHRRRSCGVAAHVAPSDLRDGRTAPDSGRDSPAKTASVPRRPTDILARPEVRAVAEGVTAMSV